MSTLEANPIRPKSIAFKEWRKAQTIGWGLAFIPMGCTLLIMGALTWVLNRFTSCTNTTTACVSLIQRTLNLVLSKPAKLDSAHELVRVSALLSWTIWSLLFATILAVAIVVSLWILFKQDLSRLGLLLIVLTVVLFVVVWFFTDMSGLHTVIVFPFTDAISSRETEPIWNIVFYSNVFKFMSYLIAGWLVVVGAIVLNSAKKIEEDIPDANGQNQESADVKENRLRRLSKCQQQIQLLLYSGGLLLACGVIHIQTTYTWAHTYFSGTDEELKAVDLFVSSLTSFAGLSFSTLLAAAYLPAALLLTHLAERQEKDPALLAKYDLNFSIQGFMVRAVTILAPLITVPLAGAIGQVFKAGG